MALKQNSLQQQASSVLCSEGLSRAVCLLHNIVLLSLRPSLKWLSSETQSHLLLCSRDTKSLMGGFLHRQCIQNTNLMSIFYRLSNIPWLHAITQWCILLMPMLPYGDYDFLKFILNIPGDFIKTSCKRTGSLIQRERNRNFDFH